MEPDSEEITPSEQTLYKDKEELKQLLSEILHQIYLDGKMEKFNEEFYVFSAYTDDLKRLMKSTVTGKSFSRSPNVL